MDQNKNKLGDKTEIQNQNQKKKRIKKGQFKSNLKLNKQSN